MYARTNAPHPALQAPSDQGWSRLLCGHTSTDQLTTRRAAADQSEESVRAAVGYSFTLFASAMRIPPKKGGTRAMNNAPSPEHYIYDRLTNQKYPVSEEIEREYYRMTSKFRQAEAKLGLCFCPGKNYRYCNTDCDSCKYHRHSNDQPFDEMRLSEQKALALSSDTAKDAEYNLLLQDVISTCTPYEQQIISLRLEGMTLTEIADTLNQPTTTVHYHYKKLHLDVKTYLQK